jgi:hypothetical protein
MILPLNPTGKHVPATLREIHYDSQLEWKQNERKTCPYKLAKSLPASNNFKHLARTPTREMSNMR